MFLPCISMHFQGFRPLQVRTQASPKSLEPEASHSAQHPPSHPRDLVVVAFAFQSQLASGKAQVKDRGSGPLLMQWLWLLPCPA